MLGVLLNGLRVAAAGYINRDHVTDEQHEAALTVVAGYPGSGTFDEYDAAVQVVKRYEDQQSELAARSVRAAEAGRRTGEALNRFGERAFEKVGEIAFGPRPPASDERIPEAKAVLARHQAGEPVSELELDHARNLLVHHNVEF